MLKRNSHGQRDVYVEERGWSKAFDHLAVSVAQLTLDGILLSANKQCARRLATRSETCWAWDGGSMRGSARHATRAGIRRPFRDQPPAFLPVQIS
jgi:hypothetical protein